MKKELEKKNLRDRNRAAKKQTFDASQVVGIVRAGLALALKKSLGPKFIMEKEAELVELARSRLQGLKELVGKKLWRVKKRAKWAVQCDYVGFNTGNGENLSYSQDTCLAWLCLAAA